jgi:hypothetical protein
MFTVTACCTLMTGQTDCTVCYLMYCWCIFDYINMSVLVHFAYPSGTTDSVTIAHWTYAYVMFVIPDIIFYSTDCKSWDTLNVDV